MAQLAFVGSRLESIEGPPLSPRACALLAEQAVPSAALPTFDALTEALGIPAALSPPQELRLRSTVLCIDSVSLSDGDTVSPPPPPH